LSGFERGRPVGGTYYLYRTLRRLDIDEIESLLREALRGRVGEVSELDRRLVDEQVAARIEQLRQAIQDEIRRRLVEDRGREAVARTLRRPLTERSDERRVG